MNSRSTFRSGLLNGLVLVLLATVVGLAWAQPTRAQGVGLSVGANFNTLDDIDSESADATFENSTGYHFGAFFEIGEGGLSVRPGVYYHRLGTYEFDTDEEFDLNAVEVPIDARLTVLNIGTIGPYILAAPVLTFAQTDEEFEDAVENLSLTADLGAGVEFGFPGAGLSLLPELRYSIGVTDYLSDDFQVGDTTVSPASDRRRVSKVVLRLNVMF